ncbi:hypothetical protein RHMOL_Rhmol11G0046400 [Rhododendron molle]|uniref:Uncharacterized protein n=1 Tax=Rhododendron molle TaxID=49168 RepID=A0ACC0LNM8_RHOML|nr:hypothetical protein RHMOL_Rhmol11G0046400 [Rhododendron molle]
MDYEEFVEDKDVFEAKLEKPGISAREAEREELLRHLELEGSEVLREFEQEAAGAEIVPRVSAMQEAQKATRVAFNLATYASRAHFSFPNCWILTTRLGRFLTRIRSYDTGPFT